MAIVMISCADEETRRELAENVARKLGYACVSREEIIEEAIQAGIPVGRLEVAVFKRTAPKRRLARQKARLLAFAIAAVCERASLEDLVFHDRACHLLLKGITHVMRVLVVPDPDLCTRRVTRKLGLDREKARAYIRDMGEDVANWVRFIHGVDMNDPGQYDLVMNLQHVSQESASALICSMARLPEFLPTPDSTRAMNNLWLAAKARDLLGRDERTAMADLNVLARDGRITVTCMPSQIQVAETIPDVLANLEGAREVVYTMAHTNLLWVAETFDPSCTTFNEITNIARGWNAAVELLRLVLPTDEEAGDSDNADVAAVPVLLDEPAPVPKAEDPTCGIEDDVEDSHQSPDGGVAVTAEQLIHQGQFGGASIVVGQARQLGATMNPSRKYSLVVVGELFACKGHEAQIRMTREVASFLKERITSPVITADELPEMFPAGRHQFGRLILFLTLSALIYLGVFTHQELVMRFITDPEGQIWHVVATFAVAGFVPVVAYLYGGATGLILRLFKIQ